MSSLSIALIGNPGSGLTTLFNQMTGGSTHRGKFSTGDRITKEGPVRDHKGVSVIELPGLYSLSAYSIEDITTRDILINGKPDVLINVIDATSFERSLYLTLQLMELEIPMVIALNMMDEVRNNNIDFDLQKLSQLLTVPTIPIAASKNQGIHELIHYAIEAAKHKTVPKKIDFCTGPVHTAIHTCAHLVEDFAEDANLPLRFCCTKLVEGDQPLVDALKLPPAEVDIIGHIVEDMEYHLGTDRESAMADMRYEFIGALSSQVVSRPTLSTKERDRSLKIDRLLTHRIFAIPIFILIMILVFYFTFSSVGEWLCQGLEFGIDHLVAALGEGLKTLGISPVLYSLIIDGVCAGVGSVLSFVPRIAVLFFFLSILEDSGYMPRVAFVMDKLLRKIGLSGRSIVPMLIGFGCSVPAIMATRTLPSKRDRFLTITLIPFMSCSAKLPLYAMFTSVFFTEHRALVMSAIYLTGIVVSFICALIFKHTIYKGDPVPFLMIMPTYRVPAIKSVGLKMWENAKGFIKKAFTVVFVATIVIWFLQNFDWGLNMTSGANDSILAGIGKFIAPIFEPLGFSDWRASTALLTGLSAKEAVVSTMAVLAGGSTQGSLGLMLSEIFTPLSAYAFIIFCLLYMPCVATLATVKREMGGWRYALSVVLFQTGVAWVVSCIIFQVGRLFL
ncbi:MAG: ferrous iron transport protein B [Anaerovoracaceae bacterium]